MPGFTIRADLRPHFAKWGIALKSQGNRPTCSVFAMTAALEFAVAERHEAAFVLSEEYLNWASNDAIGEYEDGGFFSDLWKGYKKHGICESRLAPYRETFDPEWKPGKEAHRQAHAFRLDAYELTWIKQWNVETGLSDEEADAMVATLRSGLPVCAGMRWPKNPVWDNSVLQMCPPEEVFDGHSVLLVGYMLEHPGDLDAGAFIARDSGGGGRYITLPAVYVRHYTNDAAVISD
ncbi:MAG: hypothetical protein GX446_17790 [Chthonomonadales bacterium]|nr:hypothetical protein [Chthonomonadales bacterium]